MTTTQTFDVTSFVSSLRQQANLLADYSAYRALCSRRLATLRKKLGKSKGQRKNDSYKAVPVTVQDLGNEPIHIHLFLYASERAWGHAMEMKSFSNEDPESISRSMKDHIKSRLQKAYLHASQLRDLILNPASKGKDIDILEVTAYVASLAGGVAFEKQHWEDALKKFSISRIAYDVLLNVVKADMFKEILASTIDPSIKYAAYQIGIPRSTDAPEITKNFFPKEEGELIDIIKRLDPIASGLGVVEMEIDKDGTVAAFVVNSVTWRGRAATVEEADIAVALGTSQRAEEALKRYITENPDKDHAAAFDELLQARQDAVDATKKAIDRVMAEGVSTGDPKFQKLQLIFTYVNYELINSRIARNRKMVDAIGKSDKKGKKNASTLKESVVLHDAILQSLDQINELPGVAADEEFGRELEAKRNFFAALRCSAIATSHTDQRNALALYHKALIYITKAIPVIRSTITEPDTIRGLDLPKDEVEAVGRRLQSEVARYRALVEMERLRATEEKQANTGLSQLPLIDNLNTYHEKIDFRNLVPYPPKLEPVPAKPIFFDIAWNYVQYPNTDELSKRQETIKSEGSTKKGLFGFFGR